MTAAGSSGAPSKGTSAGTKFLPRNPARDGEEQAVAQLLSVDGEVLVCSYLPRTAGQY